MNIINTVDHLKELRKSLNPQLKIGLVPTMGALHPGHTSLFERARTENDIVFASIFVNPRQFNDVSDFTQYPQTPKQDLEILNNCQVDYCFMPNVDEIYHDKNAFTLSENVFSTIMEGKHRPGHFDGVLTVVLKLFNLIAPHQAYFGEKDYQQLMLIQNMIAAFFMDIQLIACPTIREPTGLPFSSRNRKLTSEQYQLAQIAAGIFHQPISDGEVLQQLHALGIKVDYVETNNNRRFIAYSIGNIRLIDNYKLS